MTLEKQAKRDLLRVIDAYQVAQKISDGGLSKLIYGAAWFVEGLRDGTGPSFGLRKYDEIIAWFAGHWPVGATWPEGVPHEGKLVRVPVTVGRKHKEAETPCPKQQRKKPERQVRAAQRAAAKELPRRSPAPRAA